MLCRDHYGRHERLSLIERHAASFILSQFLQECVQDSRHARQDQPGAVTHPRGLPPSYGKNVVCVANVSVQHQHFGLKPKAGKNIAERTGS